MCSICLQSPCHPRCPNFDPSPWAVYTCVDCDEPIMDGDEFVETTKGKMHLDCLTDYPYHKMFELVGVDVETAEKEIPE